MYVAKVMKRKDASSVMVAVVLAIFLATWLPSTVTQLSEWVAMVDKSSLSTSSSFRVEYLQPFAFFVLQVLALEVALRLFVWVRSMSSK